MKRPIVALSAVALLATACSHNAQQNEGPSPPTVTSPTVAKAPGHIGDKVDLIRADGSKVAATLVEVINPATVAHIKGDAGKTYIATKFSLVNTGETTIEGDVNVNVSVVGSDNQSYTPDLNDVTECANFDEGTFHLNPGESAAGCVVFALPHGVTPAKVKYIPSAGFADDFGEWLVS